MLELNRDQEIILRYALGRVQACVDQVVGVQHCLKEGAPLMPEAEHLDHTLRVMSILQGQLDLVWQLTGQSAAAVQADGANWLMKLLRSR